MPARIAVIGGGISGAALFHSLEEYFGDSNDAGATVQCDLYDQGRAVGGRTSTRFVNDKVRLISSLPILCINNQSH